MQRQSPKPQQAAAIATRKRTRKSMVGAATAAPATDVSHQNLHLRLPASMLVVAKETIAKYKTKQEDNSKELCLLKTLLGELTEVVEGTIAEARERKWQRQVSELEQKLAEAMSEIERLQKAHRKSESQLKNEIAKLEDERDDIAASYLKEIEDLQNRLSSVQKDLNEQHVCVICHEQTRNTLVLPCSHFQFCLTCILEHKKINGDTCPTCRGHIDGFCVSEPPSKQRNSSGK